MLTLDISNAGVSSSFTITPTGTVSSAAYAQYSWIIAQTTGGANSITLPNGMSQGENLLTNAPMNGAANAFVLNTNGFIDAGSPGTFTLEAMVAAETKTWCSTTRPPPSPQRACS